jgi:hypothetical protein
VLCFYFNYTTPSSNRRASNRRLGIVDTGEVTLSLEVADDFIDRLQHGQCPCRRPQS